MGFDIKWQTGLDEIYFKTEGAENMFDSFGKWRLSAVSALLLAGSLSANGDSNASEESCTCNRLYLGAYGGGMFSNSSEMSQMGTALYLEAVGGPLAVEAQGGLKKNGKGFGGVQLGYEWSKCLDDACSSWAFAPTAEIEGYWVRRKLKGSLNNQTDTDRIPEHDFIDSFHLTEGVYLANFILSLNNTWRLSPYVGAGVGATRLSLHDADSSQVSPPEIGINHFNSSKFDSTWAFAAQVKAGLRYNVWKFHFFGEYRYLFVDSSWFTFGSTVYPTHPHTTPWNVKIQDIQYNAFVIGVQFDLL